MNFIMSIATVAPREDNFKEHEHTLSIDKIQAIDAIKPSHRHSQLDMSPEAIPTEMIQLCINTLQSHAVTPKEEVLGYFTRKKLQQLSTWDKWKAGETKQINQFHSQGMFGTSVHPDSIPNGSIILRPHWQYAVKRSGV